MDIRFANILFEPLAVVEDVPELFYRSDTTISKTDKGYLLPAGSDFDFCTYFNALSLEKWKRYTNANLFFLNFEAQGSFDVTINGWDSISEKKHHPGTAMSPTKEPLPLPLTSTSFDEPTPAHCEVFLPPINKVLLSFTLHTNSDVYITEAFYSTRIENESDLNPVNLSVAMTTFNNEKYVLPNIKMFEQMLSGDSYFAQHTTVHIVDNGRSLPEDITSHPRILVHPNPNAGGAGGFTRGIIETLEDSEEQTHVLLMDDDVSISPESFFRTFNLLRLRNEQYQDACISGAMLQLEKPRFQHEDVGFVRKDGCYSMVKPLINISRIDNLLVNEEITTEIPNAYGAWWYCCIPLTLVRKNGLPLPLFIRCDDVEYGMRIKPTIMTMNGIGVWHASFAGRFRASVDYYQYTRNMLIVNALNDCTFEALFMMRFKRSVYQEINTFAYDNAALLLDGLEDYLKGPNFIMQADGSKLMKENGARNEKLLPLDEVEQIIGMPLSALYEAPCSNHLTRREAPGNKITRFASSFVFNPHGKKKAASSEFTPENTVMVSYDGHSYLSTKTQGACHVIALNEDGGTAAIRTFNQERYNELKQRYSDLISRYDKTNGRVVRAYKAALPTMSSVSFWKSYLGVSE